MLWAAVNNQLMMINEDPVMTVFKSLHPRLLVRTEAYIIM